MQSHLSCFAFIVFIHWHQCCFFFKVHFFLCTLSYFFPFWFTAIFCFFVRKLFWSICQTVFLLNIFLFCCLHCKLSSNKETKKWVHWKNSRSSGCGSNKSQDTSQMAHQIQALNKKTKSHFDVHSSTATIQFNWAHIHSFIHSQKNEKRKWN